MSFTDRIKLYASDVMTFEGEHGKLSACILAFAAGFIVRWLI